MSTHRGISLLSVSASVLNNLQLCLVETHQAEVQPGKEATLHTEEDKTMISLYLTKLRYHAEEDGNQDGHQPGGHEGAVHVYCKLSP